MDEARVRVRARVRAGAGVKAGTGVQVENVLRLNCTTE